MTGERCPACLLDTNKNNPMKNGTTDPTILKNIPIILKSDVNSNDNIDLSFNYLPAQDTTFKAKLYNRQNNVFSSLDVQGKMGKFSYNFSGLGDGKIYVTSITLEPKMKLSKAWGLKGDRY